MTDAAIRACLISTVTEWGSSRESAWRECPMSEDLAYRQKILPIYQKPAQLDPFSDLDVMPDYFSVGQIVHAGLCYLHKHEADPLDVTRWLSEHAADPEAEYDLGHVVEAARLLKAYCAHWDVRPPYQLGLPEDWRVAGAEVFAEDRETFAVPMTRRWDLAVRVGARGRIAVMDHKTRSTKVPDGKGKGISRAEFASRLACSPAVLGQSWLAMRHFKLTAPPPVIYNCIVKTKIPSFARVEIEISQAQIDRWLVVQKDEAGYRTGRNRDALYGHPARQNWDACYPIFGSPCRYAKWCHGSEETRARHYHQAAQ